MRVLPLALLRPMSARISLLTSRLFSSSGSVPSVPLRVIDAKRRLLEANAVCFDVDSTVIQDEGIDVLAEFNGAGEAVKEWTQKYVRYPPPIFSILLKSHSFSHNILLISSYL